MLLQLRVKLFLGEGGYQLRPRKRLVACGAHADR
jgi:hypothetical protein